MQNTTLNNVVNNGFTWKPPTAEQELLNTVKSMDYLRIRNLITDMVKDCHKMDATDWWALQEVLAIAVYKHEELRTWLYYAQKSRNSVSI